MNLHITSSDSHSGLNLLVEKLTVQINVFTSNPLIPHGGDPKQLGLQNVI